MKISPLRGSLPVLQYCTPGQLQIDESYQRSLDNPSSRLLIARIANDWDWDLCQPLVIARRADGGLYVVDGQHRLAAARIRPDIAQLPCVISSHADAASEAAAFVALNGQRRRLTAMDLFRAAVASGNERAGAIMNALTAAGLRLSPSSNLNGLKPGAVWSLGTVQSSWERTGSRNTAAALKILGKAFPGEVLRYFGTIIGGLALACADVYRADGEAGYAELEDVVKRRDQATWYEAILTRKAIDRTHIREAGRREIMAVWRARKEAAEAKVSPRPAPPPKPAPAAKAAPPAKATPSEPTWCSQCERRRHPGEIETCPSKFCSFKIAA